MSQGPGYTTRLEELLQKWSEGDLTVVDEIISHSQERLRKLATHHLNSHHRLRRWEGTDDVLQNALVRLWRAMKAVSPRTKREFHGLAALQIRRELVDLDRKIYGKEGIGKNHYSERGLADSRQGVHPRYERPDGDEDSFALSDMTLMHESVEKLPEEIREVFDLTFYQGLSQAEVAQLIGVTDRTVKRRLRDAKLQLHRMLDEE